MGGNVLFDFIDRIASVDRAWERIGLGASI